MTTVAYVAAVDGGRTFSHQAWMSPENVSLFQKLTDAVHREGAAVSVQIGHAGNMADSYVSGSARRRAVGTRLYLFGLTLPHKMSESDIEEMARAHGRAVARAREAGFDAVEIHAGHGYLISQFLSPYTNRRTDRFGGCLENRARFLSMVMAEARKAAAGKIAPCWSRRTWRTGSPAAWALRKACSRQNHRAGRGGRARPLRRLREQDPLLHDARPHPAPGAHQLPARPAHQARNGGMFSRIMIKDYPYTRGIFP